MYHFLAAAGFRFVVMPAVIVASSALTIVVLDSRWRRYPRFLAIRSANRWPDTLLVRSEGIYQSAWFSGL
jgi:hypothetical protein